MLEKVRQECQEERIVPIYKRKGDKMISKNYRWISLLNVVGQIYERVLVSRVKN